MKAIHYINQFFGQVGGEDAADAKPIFHDGIIGCSMMLNGMMPDVEVTNTIVCGEPKRLSKRYSRGSTANSSICSSRARRSWPDATA